MTWRREDTEKVIADVLIELAIAQVSPADGPRALIDALYARGWSVAPTSVVMRGTL